MKRQIRWTEKCETGDRVDIRVSIHGKEIKWQFKRRGMKEWDYDSPPSTAQWDELEARLQTRVQRGHDDLNRDIALVKQSRSH